MNNRRNNLNRNLRNHNRRRVLLNKKIAVILATMTVMFTLLFTVGLAANAKEEQPLYKYYQSYMVEKGDTLFSIAYDLNADECSDKQIKECVEEMMSINSLDHKGTICYGNYIIVPYYSTEYR